MKKDVEAEVKRVRSLPKTQRPQLRRDPTMTGGEKSETPAERTRRKREAQRPKEPPIIQKEAT